MTTAWPSFVKLALGGGDRPALQPQRCASSRNWGLYAAGLQQNNLLGRRKFA
jgi:hypothetical protein